jgi:iron complex transport system ATP-binding protein
VLPQQTVLQFAFRCLDVIMMGRYRLGGAGDDEALGRVMAATDTQYLSQRIYPTLSGGEQARVSLARVLAQEAPILLLDEPTASLDLRHQELVMATLRGICAGGGAVVAVVHDLNLAARHADRVAMMGGGRVVAQGGVADVLTAALVGRVYRQPVEVLDHPTLGHPVIFPTS